MSRTSRPWELMHLTYIEISIWVSQSHLPSWTGLHAVSSLSSRGVGAGKAESQDPDLQGLQAPGADAGEAAAPEAGPEAGCSCPEATQPVKRPCQCQLRHGAVAAGGCKAEASTSPP